MSILSRCIFLFFLSFFLVFLCTVCGSPEDIVDTDDALGLRVAAVVDNGALGLHPHVASMLRQHTVLTTHSLSLSAHCREKRRENDIYVFCI